MSTSGKVQDDGSHDTAGKASAPAAADQSKPAPNPKANKSNDDVISSSAVGPSDDVQHGDWLVVKRKKSKKLNANNSKEGIKGTKLGNFKIADSKNKGPPKSSGAKESGTPVQSTMGVA